MLPHRLINLLTFGFSCCFLLTACSDPPPPEPTVQLVKALQLGNSSGLAKRAFPGRAEAAQEAALSFRVGGRIETLRVKVGDTVKQGDVLASLEQADFINTLKIAQSGAAKAQAALTNAQTNHNRSINVQQDDAGAISQRAVDRTLAALAIAKAAVNAANSTKNIAADRLAYTELKAPFGGEVVANYSEAFESVLLKQPVLRLLNRSNIEFKIDIPESLMAYVSDIETAVVVFDAQRSETITASIKEIGREASRGTRTYPITLLLDKTEAFDILPGMAGTATITAKLAVNDQRMSIPAAALFKHPDGGSAVWTIVDNKLVQQKVNVGLPTDFGIEVTSGLGPGDWIVTAGVHSLTAGQLVKVIQ